MKLPICSWCHKPIDGDVDVVAGFNMHRGCARKAWEREFFPASPAMGGMDETYKWTVEIEIDPVWVADGFNLTAARLEDMIASVLGYASPDEYQGTIIKAPDPKQIRAEQGEHIPGYGARYQE